MDNIKIFTKKEINNLMVLPLSNKISSTEANLYLYNDLKLKRTEVFKIFYRRDDTYIKDKTFIIKELINNKELLSIEELVLPDYLVQVDGKIVGYSMPYIKDNFNLTMVLNSKDVRLSKKIQYLKSIYQLLEFFINLSKNNNFLYLSDIHESNFIYDLNKSLLKVIDLDSAYINNSRVFPNKYLACNPNISGLENKYPIDKNTSFPIPSSNTTIASFIFMFLNTLSNDMTWKYSILEFYDYIYYLDSIGVDSKILDDIESVYSYGDIVSFDINNLYDLDLKKDYSFKLKR